jgi:hypothetical protein
MVFIFYRNITQHENENDVVSTIEDSTQNIEAEVVSAVDIITQNELAYE